MDLGAAVEGIALAYFAMLLLVSLAVHLLAVVIASIGLAAGDRVARVLSLSALAIVTVNHIGLVYLGAWHGVVLGCAVIWTVILTSLVGYIGGVVIRSLRRRPTVASQ